MDIQRSLGDRFLEIRFEKLNQDHYEVGKQILEFAGIEYTDSFVLQALAANERRLDLPEPPEPWKTNYSVWRALRFSRVAGEALIRAHYEEDRGWWFRPFKRS